MTFSLKKHKNELLFVPLGGAGEIGMNLNLYHMDGKWLMVDFGAGFAEDFLPGVDMIVPVTTFIEKYKSDLVGLVLTHAHEDHLGAIVYLWELFDCPIYCTPFTAAFLKAKIADSKLKKKVKIIIVETNSSLNLAPFELELLQITHSVPEMNAVIIKTKYGKIFHSGDWKLDPNPLIGSATDEDRIRKLGDEGILAYVGDSTNVFSPGVSGSEGDLRVSLTELIASRKNMIVVTTFASNVARIETVAKAAQACGRKVVLSGRSLWRIVRSAYESGYLLELEDVFLEDNKISSIPRNKLLVLATGCQGEPLASTAKIANDSHNNIKMRAGDTIIFSSKIIPGNDKRIFRIINQFVKKNIEVLTEKNAFVHVSGHPNRDEIKRMYELVRPNIAIPVHGEIAHMAEHAKIADSVGVKHTIKVENGDLIRIAPGNPEKLSVVESGILAVDGNFLLAPDSNIMKTRRKIKREGIIIITLILDGRSLHMSPIISAPGVLDEREDEDVFVAMEEEIDYALGDCFDGKKRQSFERIIQVTRSAARRVIRSEVGKNPQIEVNIRDI